MYIWVGRIRCLTALTDGGESSSENRLCEVGGLSGVPGPSATLPPLSRGSGGNKPVEAGQVMHGISAQRSRRAPWPCSKVGEVVGSSSGGPITRRSPRAGWPSARHRVTASSKQQAQIQRRWQRSGHRRRRQVSRGSSPRSSSSRPEAQQRMNDSISAHRRCP